MNNTIISGYLPAEPELTVLNEDQQVCKFRVGVRINKDTTCWYSVEVWGNRAEQINKDIPMGKKVIVSGMLKPEINVWIGNDGKPRANYELYGNEVEW